MPEQLSKKEINSHIHKILTGEIKKNTIDEWNDRFLENNPHLNDSMAKQLELVSKYREITDKRFELEDRVHKLYAVMIKEAQLEGVYTYDENLPQFYKLLQIQKDWINDIEQAQDILVHMKKSKVNDEIVVLEREIENTIFKSYIAKLDLEEYVQSTRNNIFSDEYNQRLNELAREGIFLYDMPLPIYPLLDESVTVEDILDSFVMNKYLEIKKMFGNMLEADESTLPVKLQRKIIDLKCAIIALENGELRSAARNLFALLEGEHKDCASLWDNYFKLSAKVKKGKERSQEISDIIKLMNHERYGKIWNIIDAVYKSITNNSKDSFINRNAIMHGDYDSDIMDITGYDVIKLFTLYCNLRMISCGLAEYTDMLKNILQYGTIYVAQDLKKKK
jgi:hypothetical protein